MVEGAIKMGQMVPWSCFWWMRSPSNGRQRRPTGPKAQLRHDRWRPSEVELKESNHQMAISFSWLGMCCQALQLLVLMSPCAYVWWQPCSTVLPKQTSTNAGISSRTTSRWTVVKSLSTMRWICQNFGSSDSKRRLVKWGSNGQTWKQTVLRFDACKFDSFCHLALGTWTNFPCLWGKGNSPSYAGKRLK